jgi:hypothetical protein
MMGGLCPNELHVPNKYFGKVAASLENETHYIKNCPMAVTWLIMNGFWSN